MTPLKPYNINAISHRTECILNVIFFMMALCCILPILLVVIVSFSSQQSIFLRGYTFFPAEFSTEAYQYFFKLGDQIIRSYGVTLFVSAFGTFFSLAVMAPFAYVLSRPDYAYRKFFTMALLIIMMFNGGIVPSYIINTRYLHLGNSIGALIFPMALNPFYIIILRTFFKTIPFEIIEAARIDGTPEPSIFTKIILPLSKPALATIGMFTVIDYWNEWFLGMLYITDIKKYPVQTLLQSMQNSLRALSEASLNALEYQDLLKSAPADNGRMALTVLVITPILLAYPFFQRYFVKGLTVGSVKG